MTHKPFDFMAKTATTSSDRRMARSQFDTSTSPRSIDVLMNGFQKFLNDEAKVREFYCHADRFVMGLPLPPWQRGREWSEEQNKRFIQSVWMEMDLGTYMVNNTEDYAEDEENILRAGKFTDILLDGQQRLSAIQDYLTGKFAMLDAEGVPAFWLDLSISDRVFFKNRVFNCSFIKSTDEAYLRTAYDLRNFGGVAHKESQRASPTLDIR